MVNTEKIRKKFNFKPLSDTRWSSRVDAIKPLRYKLNEICESLNELSNDMSKEFKTRHMANSLLNKISNYKFLCSIVIWYNLLFEINVVSKLLQNPDENINTCLNYLKDLTHTFKKYRSDETFESFLLTANNLAAELEVETNFEYVRPRKKPKKYDYEADDEVINNPKTAFKVNFYNCILDKAISSIETRFESLNEYHQLFGFVLDTDISYEMLLKSCKDLHLKLTDEQ